MNEAAKPEEQLDVLVFRVSDQHYGLPLSEVREVLPAITVTRLPGAPAVIEGVINLRGSIVPVIDIRAGLRLPAKAAECSDRIVVARVGENLLALRADRMVGLARLQSGDVESAISLTAGIGLAKAVAKLPDGPAFILDLCAVLSQSESAALGAAPTRACVAKGDE